MDVIAGKEHITVAEVMKSIFGNKSQIRVKTSDDLTQGCSVFQTIEKLETSLPGKIIYKHCYYDQECPPEADRAFIVYRCQTAAGKTYRPALLTPKGWAMKFPEKPWPIYNRKNVYKSQEIIITEGEKAADALISIGLVSTCSAGGAKNARNSDWQPLAGKTVYVWPDNDENGFKYGKDVEAELMKLNPRPNIYTYYPERVCQCKGKDAYDVVEQVKKLASAEYGMPKEVIQATKSFVIGLIKQYSCVKRPSSSLEQFISDAGAGLIKTVPFPWPILSRLAKPLLPGAICLLCGEPGSGKSFFLLQCLNFWLQNGYEPICYMLEEDKKYHLNRALAQMEGNPNLTDLDWLNANGPVAKEAYIRQSRQLDGLAGCIDASPKKQLKLDDLVDWARDKAMQGKRVIAVDPVTAAEPSEKPWVADSKFLAQFQKILDDYKCSALLVTHPKKGQKIMQGLDGLAGSAAYQRFAQTVLWLEHITKTEFSVEAHHGMEKVSCNRKIHISKARNGCGHKLQLAYHFMRRHLSFAELGVIHKEDIAEAVKKNFK